MADTLKLELDKHSPFTWVDAQLVNHGRLDRADSLPRSLLSHLTLTLESGKPGQKMVSVS